MKHVFLTLMTTVAIGAAPAPKLTDQDFEQLMRAAVAASVVNAGIPSQTICVQRELESPLKLSKETIDTTHVSGLPGLPIAKLPQAQEMAAEKAFAAALTPGAAVGVRTAMPSLPAQFVLYSSAAVPAKCVIDHGLVEASQNHAVTITLTQPVFADGFAFIDQTTGCAGLCGSGWLRVFKKQNGKWTQVEYPNLFVS